MLWSLHTNVLNVLSAFKDCTSMARKQSGFHTEYAVLIQKQFPCPPVAFWAYSEPAWYSG